LKWQLDAGMTFWHNPMMTITIVVIPMLHIASIFYGFTATWEQGTIV
jgi:hypothetical protein